MYICIDCYRKIKEINNFLSSLIFVSILYLLTFLDSTWYKTRNSLEYIFYIYLMYVHVYGYVICHSLWNNEGGCSCSNWCIWWKKKELCWPVYGPLRHRMRQIKYCVGSLVPFSGSQDNSKTLSPTEYHHNLKKSCQKQSARTLRYINSCN